MEKRPKLNIKLSALDKAMEWLGWAALTSFWIIVVLNYSNLPQIIPSHYNAAGKVDAHSQKSTILILPIIATIIYIGLTILNKYPHIFNYPYKITYTNANTIYTIASRMLRYLKMIIVIIFAVICIKTIQIANGNENSLGPWFLATTISLIFFPIIYFLVQVNKNKFK